MDLIVFIMCGILYVIPSFIIIFTSCIKYASVSVQFLVILEFFCSRLLSQPCFQGSLSIVSVFVAPLLSP